jgi:dihydrofolate synthase/folylpolyglutamate synthase
LYVSPYVLDFRERIQIDGDMIPKERLVQVVARVREAAATLPQDEGVTEFELITAAAFLYYYEENCDVVVLETGLGGRLDATNVIDCPLVNVIVSISLDHTAVLGDTLAAIAGEKCGTLKDGGVCDSYPLQPPEAMEVIRRTSAEKGVTLLVPDANGVTVQRESIRGTDAVIDGLHVHVPMLGRHMVYNASAVVVAARVLNRRGLSVSDAQISAGIAQSVMPARMQIVRESPLIIMDGGHNEGCALAFRDAVRRFLPDRRIVGICGLMADKAYETYLSIVAPLLTAS